MPTHEGTARGMDCSKGSPFTSGPHITISKVRAMIKSAMMTKSPSSKRALGALILFIMKTNRNRNIIKASGPRSTCRQFIPRHPSLCTFDNIEPGPVRLLVIGPDEEDYHEPQEIVEAAADPHDQPSDLLVAHHRRVPDARRRGVGRVQHVAGQSDQGAHQRTGQGLQEQVEHLER